MLLKELEIRNICQHRNLSYRFGGGVVGIIGSNGAGKSNLVHAIAASLTNDFNFRGRTKEQQISRGSDPKEPAYVKATWEHGGTTFTVKRSLRPNKSSLTIAGETITNNAKIAKRLEMLLGVNDTIIKNYVFVDQWKIFSFLSEQPSERKINFARVCGCDKLEDLWSVLGDQIKLDGAAVETLTQTLNTDKLRLELETAESELGDTQQEVDALLSQKADDEEIDRLQRLVASYHAKQRAQERRKTLVGQYKQEAETLPAIAKDAATKKKALDAMIAESLAKRVDFQEASDRIKKYGIDMARWKQYGEVIEERDELTDEIDELEEVPAPEKSLDAVTEELGTLRQQLVQSRKFLATFVDGVAECPTCGTKTDQLASHLAETKREVRKLTTRVAALEEEKSKLAKETKEYNDAQAKLTFLNSSLKALKTRHKELLEAEPKKPTGDIAADREIIDQFNRLQDDVRKSQFACTVAEQAHGSLVQRLETLKKSVQSADADVKKYSNVDADAANKAKEVLDANVEIRVKLSAATTRRDMLTSNVAAAKSRLAAAETASKQNETLIDWLGDLKSWRNLVHRDNLPKVFMRAMMDDLVEQMQDRLFEFGSPFGVTVDDDLAFTVVNGDGTSEPANSKSGGEMVVLAIAYRLAVNARFAENIGSLFLDEPTAGLDKHNIGCLRDMLSRIGSVLMGSGQQIFLITHDNRLQNVFSQVVQL